jgi:hypothetical protein
VSGYLGVEVHRDVAVGLAGALLAGEVATLEFELDPAAGPTGLEALDLAARVAAGLRVGEGLAGPVGERP